MAVLTYVFAGGLALWSAWRLLRNQPVILKQLLAAVSVEILLLVQVVLVGVAQARGLEEGDPAKLWGYLISALIILPGAAFWAFADRTRWSSAVLLTAHLTVIVLVVRLSQIWSQEVVPL